MSTTVVQFATASIFEGTSSDRDSLIDADDGTFGRCLDPVTVGNVSSVILKSPSIPAGTIDSVTVRNLWRYDNPPPSGQTQVATIYSREGDGNAWTMRKQYQNTLPTTKPPTENLTVIPFTSLADVQILVETFTGSTGDPLPDDPPVS